MVLFKIIGLFTSIWVILSIITSIIHKFNIHYLDKYICYKCISFWSSLIITQDLYIASIIAMLMYLFEKYDKKEIEL